MIDFITRRIKRATIQQPLGTLRSISRTAEQVFTGDDRLAVCTQRGAGHRLHFEQQFGALLESLLMHQVHLTQLPHFLSQPSVLQLKRQQSIRLRHLLMGVR
eukprot:6103972-Prymnesium_polylepis.1